MKTLSKSDLQTFSALDRIKLNELLIQGANIKIGERQRFNPHLNISYSDKWVSVNGEGCWLDELEA